MELRILRREIPRIAFGNIYKEYKEVLQYRIGGYEGEWKDVPIVEED